MMTPRERVMAALEGKSVDRPPIAFWGHVYNRELTAQDLVDATLDFQREYGWDWIKLNPRKHYHVEPWGVVYRYSGRRNDKPALEHWPIHGPSDWSRIDERPIDRGAFAEQIEAVRLMRKALAPDVPLIATVFTPLAILGEMTDVPETLKAHLAESPEAVRGALEAVTRTFERFVPALLEAGAEGIFFATVDWGSRDYLSIEDHARWSRAADQRILAAAARAPFNVLHVCKSRNLVLDLADYPVRAFSWAATDPSNPSLAQVLARTKGAVMGGISHDSALLEPRADAALAELRQGFEATGGRRWLVAPGCSISPATPPSNLRALRDAVETLVMTREHSP